MSFRATLKFVLFFFIALTPMVVKAQQTGATVSGLVEDPDTALIPGATVTLTPTTGKALTTQSQSDGTYVLHNVPAGTYSMTVTMQGFASFVKMGVKVSAGQALTRGCEDGDPGPGAGGAGHDAVGAGERRSG